jgi:hypothetical protein
MICVTVSPKIINNIIKSDQVLCAAGSIPSPLVQASGNIGGGNGTFTYKWELSADGGITWTPAGTNPTYAPPALFVQTQYRRIVFSGGCSDTSKFVIISFSQNATGGNTNADDTVCSGSKRGCYHIV